MPLSALFINRRKVGRWKTPAEHLNTRDDDLQRHGDSLARARRDKAAREEKEKKSKAGETKSEIELNLPLERLFASMIVRIRLRGTLLVRRGHVSRASKFMDKVNELKN